MTHSTTTEGPTTMMTSSQRVITSSLNRIQKSKPAKKIASAELPQNVACPGSQRASNCQMKCRECKETSCKRRNSKSLHKTCPDSRRGGIMGLNLITIIDHDELSKRVSDQ